MIDIIYQRGFLCSLFFRVFGNMRRIVGITMMVKVRWVNFAVLEIGNLNFLSFQHIYLFIKTVPRDPDEKIMI